MSSPNFSQLQSAHRPLHSTETALLRTLDDIDRSSHLGKATILVSIHLSSASDMVNHGIPLVRLYASFVISGAVFSWLHSLLTSRSQCVHAGQSSSTYKHCSTGVPQGSVLGPLLFTTYIFPHF